MQDNETKHCHITDVNVFLTTLYIIINNNNNYYNYNIHNSDNRDVNKD